MNKGLVTVVFSITAFAHATSQQANKLRWEDFSSLLGQTDSSRKLSAFFRHTDKPERIQRNANEYDLVFDEQGYTLSFHDAELIEVEFQLVPGKKIKDRAFVGTLPLGITNISLTPEEAIQRFGPPLSDVRRGYRKISYEREERLITLYFSGDHLEFITVRLK